MDDRQTDNMVKCNMNDLDEGYMGTLYTLLSIFLLSLKLSQSKLKEKLLERGREKFCMQSTCPDRWMSPNLYNPEGEIALLPEAYISLPQHSHFQ